MATCTINAPGRELAPAYDHLFDQAMMAVWNGSTTKTLRLIRLEFDYPNYTKGAGISDDAIVGWANFASVYAYHRCTDGPPTGGTNLTPIKRDTSAADLPAQVVFQSLPTGGPSRDGSPVVLFQRAWSSGQLTNPWAWGPGPRSSWSLADWDTNGTLLPEPIVLREGEGFCMYHMKWGPTACSWHIVLRNASTNETYSIVSDRMNYYPDTSRPAMCLWNGSGSGVVLQVLRITAMADAHAQGENHNATLHRIYRPPTGEEVTPMWHDPSDEVAEFKAYCGATCDTNAENAYSGLGGTNITTTAFWTTGARYQDDIMRMFQIAPGFAVNQLLGIPQLSWTARNDEEAVIVRPGEGLAVRFPTPHLLGFLATAWYGQSAGPFSIAQVTAFPQWAFSQLINTRAVFASGPDVTVPSGAVVMNRIFVR